jgi:uncharacterized membrane protein required for colicin V production
MPQIVELIQSMNIVSVIIVLVLAGSVAQGMIRGGSGSVKHLALILTDGILALLSLFLTWKCAEWLSPWLQDWLIQQHITIPSGTVGPLQQIYYTFITGIRDFPLLRFGVIFVLGYGLIKFVLFRAAYPLLSIFYSSNSPSAAGPRSGFSGLVGAAVGCLTGAGRALVLVAVLFIYTTLFPHAPLTAYIQASDLYQKGATEVIQPFTGDFIAEKVPVFTRAVEAEFSNILQRKYEVIDANIPDDIAEAAKTVTAGADTDEEKARKLYQWVGTRVKYDWDKVEQYETKRIWHEQSPEETFSTRKGVCIDYSRLYSVMARSVGLKVKVETGLGYDGQGGYGPHAWNVVYLSAKDEWVPLDSTWVASGGNWFNPPHFYDTHIKEA